MKSSLRPARSLAVIGVGSDLRGDDIAGILVLRHLRAALERSRLKNIRLFDGGTAPENLTGEIIRFKPSHILLVDAADLGLKPGTTTLIAPEDVVGISFSTHVLPLSILTDYFKRSLPCRIIILGIQPGATAFSPKHSPAVSQAARRLAQMILDAAPRREAKRQRAAKGGRPSGKDGKRRPASIGRARAG